MCFMRLRVFKWNVSGELHPFLFNNWHQVKLNTILLIDRTQLNFKFNFNKGLSLQEFAWVVCS